MILSRINLKNIQSSRVAIPPADVFELPEKVLQFGTGVLLRGLPDYFIDKANRQGVFNGRIVVVKSTDRGGTDAFEKQDGMFTHCIRGVEEGRKIEQNIVNASISRVLSAKTDWNKILNCAHNPLLQVVISNTTEVGIQLVHDDIRRHPPQSFPGKLLAFLYERYLAFAGSQQSGMVIVPTELIPDNGKKLESIVLELAHLNGLEERFIQWLENANTFCSSLVDRIVPGNPGALATAELEKSFGYSDSLLMMSESYCLWAIEGGPEVRAVLSFGEADSGVVISPDINRFRELKLRMLNGTHTLSCGLAFLGGHATVGESMDDPQLSVFISNLMMDEIATGIPYEMTREDIKRFGEQVLDRFRNSFIAHHWINITMQYTSKMKMRIIPVLSKYVKEQHRIPPLMALGFAAYLHFTKPVVRKDNGYYGEWKGREYLIKDDYAAYFYEKWSRLSQNELIREVLGDQNLWGEDLNALDGFGEAVIHFADLIYEKGVRQALQTIQSKKATGVT